MSTTSQSLITTFNRARRTRPQGTAPRSQRRRARRARTARNRGIVPRNSRAQLAATALVRSYISTLRDPFSNGPLRVGWGTMVPTDLFTAYVRTTIDSAADGSLALIQMPSLGGTNGQIFYNNGGLASLAWTPLPYSNHLAIIASAHEARVVSGGLRVMPQIPATAAPATVYAGSVPSMAVDDFQAIVNPDGISTSPSLTFGYGAGGASAVIHPLDPESFSFTVAALAGYAAATHSQCSTPVIVFKGLPPTTPVILEGVLNIETIQSWNSGGAAMSSPQQAVNTGPTLSSVFNNIESMWTAIRPYIPSAATVNSASSLATNIALPIARLNAVRAARQAYFPRLENMQNRVVIEEIA